MHYFNSAFTEYFAALSANNNTTWFDANRRWYEKEVKYPFQEFVDELIVQLKRIDPDINIEPQEAIFRINNDIRYSKEKIPYKPWMTANISAVGKRSKEYPGFFIQANHEKLAIAGGVYCPERETLIHIRQQILQDPEGFRNAINDPLFKTTFIELDGELNKLLQPEFRKIAESLPEIGLKQFYFRKEYSPETLYQKNLPEFLRKEFQAATNLHLFLRRAFRLSVAA